MSSNHTRVSAREWEQMQQDIAETEAYVISREEEARRLRQESEQRSREIARQHEENMRAIDRAVDSLSDTYRDAVGEAQRDFSRELGRETEAFRGQFRALVEELRDVSGDLSRSDSRIENLAQRFSEAVQARINGIAQRQARAQAVVEQLDGLMAQIESLSPRQFLPAEYAGLQAVRASIQASVQAGDAQAALAVSQNGLLSAGRLLTRLTLENERFHQQLTEARNAASALTGRMDALSCSSGVLRVEAGGEEQEYDYDIRYWSNGGFDALSRELAQLQARLEEGTMSPHELEQIQARLRQLDGELTHCDGRSRQALASSVFVEDTAMRLHNCLSQRGWELAENGHYQDESREPFTMEYTDGDGNIVSIVVSPGERTEEPIYAVEVYAEDEYRGAVIKEGIHASMAAEGLQIRGIERRDDCHLNPTPEDFRQNMVQEARRRQTQTS